MKIEFICPILWERLKIKKPCIAARLWEVGDTRENLNRFIDDLKVLIDLRKNHSEDTG